MSARDLLQRASDAGVELYLDGHALKARGCREAVQALAPELRAQKAEIVVLLAGRRMVAVNDPATPALESPPSNQPPIPDGAGTHAADAGLDKPVKPRKLTFMEWQQGWIEFDQAYQRHHLNCPVCIAAGLGYGLRCGAGAALYRAYEDAAGDRGGLS